MTFGSWQALLREPGEDRHIVQIYREPAFLREAVAEWALPALESGGGVVLLGRRERTDAILQRLRAEGVGVEALRARGRLFVGDADDVLPRVVRDGEADADAFRSLVTGVVRGVRDACGSPGREVRAWGELVEVLRGRGQMPVAQRLEALWNEIIAKEDIRLLCSYQVDNLSPETHEGVLADVCAGHSQLIPEDDFDALDRATTRALADVFGETEAQDLRASLAKERTIPVGMPPAEAVLVALQETRPEDAKRVLHAARRHLSASQP